MHVYMHASQPYINVYIILSFSKKENCIAAVDSIGSCLFCNLRAVRHSRSLTNLGSMAKDRNKNSDLRNKHGVGEGVRRVADIDTSNHNYN